MARLGSFLFLYGQVGAEQRDELVRQADRSAPGPGLDIADCGPGVDALRA
jgi:hypothetical protein